MEMYGNSNDPLAKTLKDLNEHSRSSSLGDAGDFFTKTHPRDPHTKPKNSQSDPLEFNSAILPLDDSSIMLRYIHLKNKIVEGECMALGESTHVDKEDGSTSVFIQWLQPKGMFELGTANPAISAAAIRKATTAATQTSEKSEVLEEDVVNDTNTGKKVKGKGTRKKNTKVTL